MWLNKFINHITKRESLLEMVLNKAIAARSSKENAITVARLGIELLTAGRTVEEVMAITGASQKTIYNWRNRMEG